jgi:hypothetical protein
MRHQPTRTKCPWSTAIRRALLLCCLLAMQPALTAEIMLSSAEDNPAIRAFTAELAARRPGDRVSFRPLDQLGAPAAISASTRLIIFGNEALEWRLSSNKGPPTLVLRIARIHAQKRLGNTRPPRLTLLWSDPSPHRQLRLVRALMPQVKRVGVLYDGHSAFLLEELEGAASELDLDVVSREWLDTRDNRPLLDVLHHSDLLFGLNDDDLFNPQTAKNLLLTSYSQQRAIIGPTASFVRAGSLASIYSDQVDWLRSLEHWLDRPPADWPRSAYPAYFKVLGNRQVARALAIELADDATLAQQVAEGDAP